MIRIIPLGFLMGVFLVGTIAPFAPIQDAYGDTIFISQDREVTAAVVLSGNAQGASNMAPDFSPFFAIETAQLSEINVGEIHAFATQDSTLDPNLITAIGSAGTAFDISQLFANSADGASTFEVEFQLTTQTDYNLNGVIFTQEILIELGNFDSSATVNLFDIDNNMDILNFAVGSNDVDGFVVADTLPPGNYRLSAAADAFGDVNDDPGEGTSTAQYDFTLQLTPVDVPECNTDADCDDGNVCNGTEFCDDALCFPGEPLDIDDGVACTVDSCDPIDGVTHDDDACFADDIVGGEFLPIDSTALLLAGVQSSAIWMLPIVAGAAGAGFAAFKLRRK